MPDVYCNWDDDLALTPGGDLRMVDGIDRGQQRIIRRLMTILSEYIWHPEYGASVPQRIGERLDDELIESVIRSQIFLEAAVARDPPPTIMLRKIESGVFVRIIYLDASTLHQTSLEFDVEI